MNQAIEARAKRIRELLRTDRENLLEFLRELGEFDAVNGYEELGYASIWDYCRRELGMIDGSIHRRVETARLMRQFPLVGDYLRDLKLCMTSISELRDVLTGANVERLLEEARGKSRDELKAIVARESAPTDQTPKTLIRRAPSARITPIPPAIPVLPIAAAATPSSEPALPLPDVVPGKKIVTEPTQVPTPTPAPAPAPEERYVVRMTVSRKFKAAYERAKSILSHAVPSGEMEEILLRGLEEIIRQDDKKHRVKPAKTAPKKVPPKPTTPRTESSTPASAHIPADLAQQVWERDGHRCTQKTADGGVCASTWQLEIDHRIPKAKGGPTALWNLRLLCRHHNDQHAREQFGEEFMARKKASRGATVTPPTATHGWPAAARSAGPPESATPRAE